MVLNHLIFLCLYIIRNIMTRNRTLSGLRMAVVELILKF